MEGSDKGFKALKILGISPSKFSEAEVVMQDGTGLYSFEMKVARDTKR